MHVTTILGYRVIMTPNFACDAIRIACEKLGIDTVIDLTESVEDRARELVQLALNRK